MGRNAIVNKEDVYAAADQLVAGGKTPTNQAIVEITRGSMSRIVPWFRQWREEQGSQPPANVSPMPDAVSKSFAGIWNTALKSAQDELAGQRQALEAQRGEMEQTEGELMAEIARLEAALEQAEDRGEGLKVERDKEREGREGAESQVSEFRVQNARLDERVKAAEAERGAVIAERDQFARESSQLAEQEKELSAKLKGASIEYAEMKTALDAAREAGVEKDAKLDALRQENARLGQHATDATARGDELREELKGLQAALAASSKALVAKKRAPRRAAKPKAGAAASPAPKAE